MNHIFEQAKTELKRVYDKYSGRGIASIYLWGSILTEDFDADRSDIDSIALVVDSTPIELQKIIGDELASSEVPRLHLNIVYLSELSKSPVKGGLCAVIDPRLLLLDFPFWKHVAGKKYNVKDFGLPKPTYRQAAEIQLQNIKNRQWSDVSRISPFERMYFVKALARLIHVLQASRQQSKEPFSYAGILKHANKEEKPVVEAINELRANNSKISFDRFVPIFQEFIDDKMIR